MSEMENKKKLLIEHWEYQKFLTVTYGADSDLGIQTRKYASNLFAFAVNQYGFDWAKANLTPLDLDTFDINRFQ